MRKSSLFVMIVVLFAACEAFGANFYVSKAAKGTNNGTSWTNAWNEMSQVNFSTVSCGDTIWLAAGTYTTGLTLNKTCTIASPLTIQSVLPTDTVPAAATGYTNSVPGKVILLNGGVDLAAGSYVTLSGRSGTPNGNNFGISVQCNNASGLGGCAAFSGAESGNISNMTVTY